MGLTEELEEKGWYLSPGGIEICSADNTNPKANDIIKQALDLDLKEIGRGFLPEDINRGKITEIPGNVVLMITKIRNIAVPKVQEENGGGGPRMLKITMTDGVTNCHGVEFTKIDSINITKSAPGLKVRLKGKTLSVMGGLIKLTPENFELLGGKVDALIEKWKLQKELFYLQRTGVGTVAGDGPPKWVPFGQKLAKGKEGGKEKQNNGTENGTPAAAGKKEKSVDEEDNSEFDAQRNNAIEEASKVERKKFGGGSKPLVDSRVKKEKERERREEERAARNKGEDAPSGEREKPERGGKKEGRRRKDEDREDKSAPPPKGFSLRDFLGDKIPETDPKKEENKEKEVNSYYESKYERRKDEDYNRGSSNRGGKSGSYQSDRKQDGGRRQDNGRQQNNTGSSGGYKQREHNYEPANRDNKRGGGGGEQFKGGQYRGQSDREERKKTPARETGSSREGTAGGGRGKGGGDEKQGGSNQRSENTKTPATRNKSDAEKSKRSGKGGRQNEEESSYDTKSAKSNLQNGHHNNSEFSKESKGRQNGYDNSDDRHRRDRDYYDNNRRGGGGDRQFTRGGNMNGGQSSRGGSGGQSSRGSDRGSRRGGFGDQSGRGSGHGQSSRGGGAPSGQSTRGGRGGRQQNGRETRQSRQKSDLGELESGLSRISLANSMSNPSAFPPLPGASNSPTPENNGGDHTPARNEEKSKQASLADSMNKQTDQSANTGGDAGPRLSAPPKTQVYGAPPGAATLGFGGHSAQGHIATVPPTSIPSTPANNIPPVMAATPPGVPPNLVNQVNSVYGPPPGVVQPGFGGPNLGGDIRPPPGGGRYPPGAPQDSRSRYLPPNVYTRGSFHNGATPHLAHHIPDHEQEGQGASFSHNSTSQPNSMDMNAFTAPRGPGFQSQQPPQNMNEGYGGYNSGNNGGYFESGDNRNDYNRQKDNYRGNRRQPPGGVTHFRGGAGSEQPIHQAFTTPPPNFTRASSSGGGFGSNSITNGGFSAGGGTGQNSSFQNHQLNLKEGDKVMAKYWEDGRFYPVEVTAVGDSTVVVLFTEYGNHEEVVWADIRPISTNHNQGGAFNRGPPPSHYRR